MKNKKYNFGIFGYGNMGRSIYELLQKGEFKNSNFFICSLNVKNIKGAKRVNSIEELYKKADIIFLCVKPRDFHIVGVVGSEFQRLELGRDEYTKIIISIMAGVTISQIQRVFPKGRIIRTMPNLALRVGEGVIGWHARKNRFTGIEILLIEKIFSSFGRSVYVKNENMLNAITAISGSGPAYVFLFVNSLIKAAKKLGFAEKTAYEIVAQTIFGSLSCLQNQRDKNLERLIKEVASKKGTTEAALSELNIKSFEKRWQKATAKAYRRARELSFAIK